MRSLSLELCGAKSKDQSSKFKVQSSKFSENKKQSPKSISEGDSTFELCSLVFEI
jgi:hypothetical protein